MLLKSMNRKLNCKIVAKSFPQFQLGASHIAYVHKFRYLGHIITDDFKDNADITREIRSLFYRTNMLIRRFGKCSMDVKRVLFRSYCLCLYDTGLWKFYKTTVINKLKSAYNRCMKMFFGYSQYHSVTQMLLDLALPSFETLITNSRFTFMKM